MEGEFLEHKKGIQFCDMSISRDKNIASLAEKFPLFNPICLRILRFQVKTMLQIMGELLGVPNWHPLEANRVNKSLIVTFLIDLIVF